MPTTTTHRIPAPTCCRVSGGPVPVNDDYQCPICLSIYRFLYDPVAECSADGIKGQWTRHVDSGFDRGKAAALGYDGGTPDRADQSHAFNRAVDTTLGICKEIADKRAGEYLDTWAIENTHPHVLRHTLRALGLRTLSQEEERLVLCASLADVKDARLLGPWKEDTMLDGINFRAAYASFREEYEDRKGGESPATW